MAETKTDPNYPARWLLGVVPGVGVGVIFVGMGAVGLGSVAYGLVAGTVSGVGIFLFIPWWARLSVIQEAADGHLRLGTVIERGGGISPLGVLGIGLGVGGTSMIAAEAESQDPSLASGLGVTVAVTVLATLVATALFRRLCRVAADS